MSTNGYLSPIQAHALFDVLTSHVTLQEIEDLKNSEAIATFGPPLQPELTDESSSPILRLLLQSFILDLPGLRDVSPHFWTDHIRQLGIALDDSNLSESYDKGSIGIRRTLSTAVASIVEAVARGRLGGYPKQAEPPKEDANYNPTKPDDLARAWDDFLQRIIYGDLLDKMFVKAAETDKLSDHEPVVQAAHQYALIILASLLHHNLIVLPRGQSMVSLLNRVHRLTPYFLIKQTLKVGNAATMLNGMVQLLLAKMNLSTITSWFGGQMSDSGMNLLQQIISQVLSAEISELRKRSKTMEQLSDAPTKPQMDLLKNYASQPAEEQHQIRTKSQSQSISIAKAILTQNSAKISLSESSHKLALDYVAIQLAIRDREKLIEVFCHRQPDLTTTSIRELVRVYDPIIRALHNAVDLASGVSDAQAFVDDLIKLSLIDKSKVGKIPTVQDFVRLLQTHQGSSHVFIHQVLKNGKELSQWYHEYACQAIQQYKQENNFPLSASHVAAAGDLTALLEELVSELSEGERCMVVGELNFHAACLQNLAPESRRSVRLIVEAPLTPGRGNSWADDKAGIFLHKWQHFIDETKITPGPEDGPPRTGKSDSVKDATAAEIDGSKPAVSAPEPSTMKRPVIFPNVSKVLCLLAPGFKDALRRRVNVKKRESGSEAITE